MRLAPFASLLLICALARLPGVEFSATFTTTAPGGQYSPAHIVAAWIENSSAGFVKTVGDWSMATASGGRRADFTQWRTKAGVNDTDAVMGATITTHTSPLTVTWNLIPKIGGAVVADGTYNLWIETIDGDSPLPPAGTNSVPGKANRIGVPFTISKGVVANVASLSQNGYNNLSITGVNPNVLLTVPTTGSGAGGTVVTCNGSGFFGTPSVSFGGVAATNVTVVSGSKLTCVTPAHAPGAVDLVITTGNGTYTGSKVYTYTLPAPVITSPISATAQVGAPFTYQIVASNTPTSYAASGLPAGLSVNAQTGVISGSPTTTGTATVTLNATNSTGTGIASLTITVNPPILPAPAITSPGTAKGTVGTAFSYQITASNAPTSYSAIGLPPELSLNPTTGLITGTPQGVATINATISALNAGGTGAAPLVITIAADPKTLLVQSFVTRFYVQCLNRQPDQAGLDSWTTSLLNGSLSGTDLARGFVLSPEFSARNLNDDAYVTVLYQAFFNRAPDQGGFTGWKAQLGSGVLREDVLYGFLQAQEFTNLCTASSITSIDAVGTQRFNVRQFVRRFYQQCLGREPDAAGVENWVQNLLNGSNYGAQVAQGFINSQEFLNRNTSDDQFLTILYLAFFNRAGDTGGLANWQAAIAGGSTRAQVVDGFIKAQEFLNLCTAYKIVPFAIGG